jgi:hypothetical protein
MNEMQIFVLIWAVGLVNEYWFACSIIRWGKKNKVLPYSHTESQMRLGMAFVLFFSWPIWLLRRKWS